MKATDSDQGKNPAHWRPGIFAEQSKRRGLHRRRASGTGGIGRKILILQRRLRRHKFLRPSESLQTGLVCRFPPASFSTAPRE